MTKRPQQPQKTRLAGTKKKIQLRQHLVQLVEVIVTWRDLLCLRNRRRLKNPKVGVEFYFFILLDLEVIWLCACYFFVPKNLSEAKVEKLDKRSFEYSRKQWTGKSPKQFIIDWVRKHLPKSPPPAYHKVPIVGNLWRCRWVRQQVPFDDKMRTITCTLRKYTYSKLN